MHGKAAVAGIGESKYYRAGSSPYSALQLAAISIKNAIEDAGLKPGDIDGLVTFMDTTRQHANVCSWFGFETLGFAANPMSGGGNLCMAAINLADAAICAGYARNVVVYRAINQGREGRYGRSRGPSVAAGEEAYRAPFGAAVPAIWNALLTKRFMHDYAVSQDALAEIALACYAHAQHNPRAVMYGRPLTREAYHNSRWIAEPFHLFDCCQENDGACALVLTSGEHARDLRKPPAYILAGASGMESGGGLWAYNDSAFPNRRYHTIGEQLWARAGVRPSEIKVAQFYENFTGSTLMAIADIGFCRPEEVEQFVSNGALQWPHGRLPFNTSGGNLAEAYIHGLQLANEAVRQIRGESTCQVADAEMSLAVGGPVTPPGSAVLFSRNPSN
jgi:acetyl-CoA acetyltransferase